jgi:hypothetical protein
MRHVIVTVLAAAALLATGSTADAETQHPMRLKKVE